ncbi:MAG: PTS sugar transporter subunit IIA [Spirochaetes bacterium]|nr:PTS sugar transporter subunit IIA [Spirochaetota bacterium]MBU0956862.1 PTS sugar transporter subunit IIA [Spirochaetota bacterium]
MNLASLLNPNAIFLRQPVQDKAEAIRILLKALLARNQEENRYDEILDLLFKREALGGTSFPTGITVPHARIENFDDFRIGILVPEKNFMDGEQEVRFVVLFLTEKSSSNLYLNALAGMMKLSADKDFFAKLIASRDADTLMEQIRERAVLVRKELTVADIMSQEVAITTKEARLLDVIDQFYSQGFSYIPVVSAENTLIGEITVLDILQIGVPAYAAMIGNLKFLKTFEPFEELLKKEDSMQVAQVMKKPVLTISPDSSLIEAVVGLTKHQRRQIPVISDGKLVGVISMMDILKKVIRA